MPAADGWERGRPPDRPAQAHGVHAAGTSQMDCEYISLGMQAPSPTAATIVIAIMLTATRLCAACSCLPPPEPLQALAGAEAVFAATVVDVENPPIIPTGDGHRTLAHHRRCFRLKVLAAWKGQVPDTVVVATGLGGGDCGAEFTIGDVYLVYAYAWKRRPASNEDSEGWVEVRGSRHLDTVSTNICTRTRSYSRAADDSAQLGVPTIDRTSGRPIHSFRPARCPVHRKRPLRIGRSEIAFDLPINTAREFRLLVAQRFPHAGVLIEAPPEHHAFGPVSNAFFCDECRKKAIRWWRRHGGRA